MSLLSRLNTIFEDLSIPVETGVYKDAAPDRYVVLTPLTESFEVFADNKPNGEVQEVRISLFDKCNYISAKGTIVTSLIRDEITITDRRYIGHEDDTGYHHYAIDVAKEFIYEMEED